MPGYSEFYFNVDHGYLEGLVRGFKAGILTSADYVNLAQCETLEGKSASLFYLGRTLLLRRLKREGKRLNCWEFILNPEITLMSFEELFSYLS